MSNEQLVTPVFPLGELFESPYFNGDVYRQPLVPQNDLNCPTSNITFAPGCINNWHSHAGGQILLCTNGRGWYQEEGKAAQELNPGDVVQIPADIKHWHGAAKDSWFTHISISTNIQAGGTDWMEPVDLEEYNKLA
ncbi:cupin domain-containing protein [Enterococcus sp. HY326]|uniref:cupin domain-containing protein n=1 Tax=Enterococcus sp. HY326 TaxID=2971265 RepID=UPI00223F70EB|nr:cupin domain-containing protein [Enterococcus sp. HY326]